MNKYRKISHNVYQLKIDNPKTNGKELYWTNVVNPLKNEIKYLRNKYNFNLSYLEMSSAKSNAQRPIVIEEKNYIFMILQFPILQNGNVVATELDFFIGENYLITLHQNVKPLNDFFNLAKKDGESLISYEYESPASLLYEILYRLMQDTFALLDKNNKAITDVEEIIFSENQKTAASQILTVRRNFINIRRIMQTHKTIIKKLMVTESHLVDRNLKPYYNKLLNYTKTIWEILENQKEMIDALQNTNESMLNYQISNIMKTLTLFSVIVFPLTLFAALFGMNTMISMPLVNHPYGFWIIVATMLTASLLMLVYFKKKRWL